MKRSAEDIEFLSEVLSRTKEQLSLTQKILKKIERDFSRNPHDEFVEDSLQEIHDSLQSLNQCLSFEEEEK